MQTPMVAAFVARCQEKNLSDAQFKMAVKTACARFPEIADEFSKAGFDWRWLARKGLQGGGGLAGMVGGGALGGLVTTPTVAGVPLGVAAGGTAGGIAGEEAGRWLGDKMLGKEEEAKPETEPAKAANARFLLPVGGAIAGGLLGEATGVGAVRGALTGGGMALGGLAGHAGTVSGLRAAGKHQIPNPRLAALLASEEQHLGRAGALAGMGLGAGAGDAIGKDLQKKAAVLGLTKEAIPVAGLALQGLAAAGRGIMGLGRSLPAWRLGGEKTVGQSLQQLGGQMTRPASRAAAPARRAAAAEAQGVADIRKALPGVTEAEALAGHQTFGGNARAVAQARRRGGNLAEAVAQERAVAPVKEPGFIDRHNAALNLGLMGAMVAPAFIPVGGGSHQPPPQGGFEPQAEVRRNSDLIDRLLKEAEYRRPFRKRAFVQELTDQWHGLEPHHKAMAIGGGTAALLAGINQFRPRSAGDHPNTALDALGLAGGLGTAAYGFSGGQPEKILPAIQGLFGGSSKPSTSSNGLLSLSKHPALGKYIAPSGELNIRALVAAPDAELKAGVKHLSPEQKAQFKQQLGGFKPSLGQRIGAKALGIDVDNQRSRFQNLLV